MDRILQQGRLIFAISVIAFGFLHFIWANFGEAVVPVIPWPPGYPWAAYLMGLVLLATGVSIAIDVRAREAPALLGILLLLSVLMLHVPKVLAHPLDLGLRTRAFEPLALSGAAFALSGGRYVTPGRCLFAISAVIFGIDHFLLLDFIAKLVPSWIPGGLFWATLTGAGFIVAGICIATKWMMRWAATWLGIMFALWVLVLHGPRVLGLSSAVPKAPHDPNEWCSAFIALAMCGASWIFADAGIVADGSVKNSAL